MSWSDQPKCVEGATILGTFPCGTGLVEIRAAGNGNFYLSSGNLFGSQTVLVRGVAALFKTLERLATSKGSNPIDLPEGVTPVSSN